MPNYQNDKLLNGDWFFAHTEKKRSYINQAADVSYLRLKLSSWLKITRSEALAEEEGALRSDTAPTRKTQVPEPGTFLMQDQV